MLFEVLCLSMITRTLASTCSRTQACSAELRTFPVIEEESSGYGSGMIPLYDEFFDSPLFDYTQTPQIDNIELCSCSGNLTCDSSLDSHNMKLDETVTLTFCDEVERHFPLACKGRRGIIRVIGPAESSGKTVASVSSTLVFCNCPSGYQRQKVSTWGGTQLSIEYKCL